MQASSGAAFTLELWLSDVETVFPFSTNGTVTTSYKREEVSYDMELVEVTPEIMTDINTELSQGAGANPSSVQEYETILPGHGFRY
jgi:hypothetical protein